MPGTLNHLQPREGPIVRKGRTYRRCTLCGTMVDGETYLCSKGHKSPRTGKNRTFSWAYAVDMGRPGGKRQQRLKGGFATEEEARAAMTRLQVEVRDGTHVDPQSLTVGKWLDRWLAGVDVRPSTKDSYELHVRARIKPAIGDVRLQDLEPMDVRALYAELKQSGGTSGRPLSAKTVHNVHLCLRKALSDAVRDRLIARNPADAAHKLPDRPEMRWWNAEQLRQFLDHVSEDHLAALWRLAAMTGMRRGELLGLRWGDVDLDHAVVAVRRQWSKAGGGVDYRPLKGGRGGASSRRIDLDAVTVTVLRQHRLRQLEDRAFLGRGKLTPADPVFCREDGELIDPDGLTQRFARHVKDARLPRIRLHDVRHTHATLALEAGVHPKVVQERLGHSSISVTLDTYSHAVPTLQVEAAGKIAAVVDG